MEQFLDHNLQFNCSFKSMENMAKLINSTPNPTIKLPTTKYKLKSFINPMFNYQFCIQCSCGNYTASSKSTALCMFCNVPINTMESDHFIYIPIEQQLKENITNNLDGILDYNSHVLTENEITDIHNAKIFKRAQEMHPNSTILPLIANTDGIKVYRSNTKSLWLIQICPAYLPPMIRYKHTMVVAAHFAKNKPIMSAFFYPLLKDIRDMNDAGGIVINKEEKTYTFLPLILSACCDLPAKADLQGTIGHSGRYGCGYCLHPGILIKGDKKLVVRYVKGSDNYGIRSHEKMMDTYGQMESTPILGIKKISCMVAAYDFDLIHSFPIDWMHCVHLGIVKKILSLWLDTDHRGKPHNMSKRQQVALSNRLVKIKPISDIIRKPKSLFSKGDFKANEFRSLLLYYLPMALDGLIHSKYIENFRLLSSACYLLSKKKIQQEEIKVARSRLNEFVNSYEILYGREMVTMNVHLARHLTMTVEHLGPLWANSAYSFEANNGVIVKSNNSTNHSLLHQLAWKYTMRQTIKSVKEEEKMNDFSMSGEKTIKITAEESELFGYTFNHPPKNFLQIYKSVVVRGIKFTSLESKEISTVDYFVRLKDESIASIRFYVIFDFNLYALVNIYEIVNKIDHFIGIKCSQLKKIVQFNTISEKMLHLNFSQDEFVTTLPNRFEKT